jgi:hypothetical protein
MYDAVNPDAISASVSAPQMVAGYVDGAWPWAADKAAVQRRWPHAVIVQIAVFSSTNAGQVGDRENGDMDEAGLVRWVLMRRAAGIDPTGYCSASNWPSCRAAFASARVPEPHWWVSAYPGGGPMTIPPGAVAHQYADMGGYDLSAVADYWAGVDAGGDMALTDQVSLLGAPVGPGGNLTVGQILGQLMRLLPGLGGDVYAGQAHPDGDVIVWQRGQFATIQTQLAALQGAITAEQAALLSAFKALPPSGAVDVAALAAQLAGPLAGLLSPLLPQGVKPADLLHRMGALLDAAQ